MQGGVVACPRVFAGKPGSGASPHFCCQTWSALQDPMGPLAPGWGGVKTGVHACMCVCIRVEPRPARPCLQLPLG